jgi:hypothetical protein
MKIKEQFFFFFLFLFGNKIIKLKKKQKRTINNGFVIKLNQLRVEEVVLYHFRACY